MRHPTLNLLGGLFLLVFGAAAAQDREDEARELETIVVTGQFVRQGGAQDIKHFRAIAEDVGMPRPESLTVEGLLGEHDLSISSSSPCRQLFCLVTESTSADFETRRSDVLFIGLGFSSNIDPASWRRPPLNLVAVVDKSGSMNGEPLERVRKSLKQIVQQMTDQDQVAIVLYGDRSHVHLTPTPIKGRRDEIIRAIDAIQSAGSTNMEAGLQVGYATAFAEAPKFKGITRLMLFTDEQPNVGSVDAGSFMSMASEASKRGIGLTTIGVGIQFDATLAAKVSSVRGGNLFFIESDAAVGDLFGREFDTMVSELAHDVTISMRPVSGYRVSGVFGVPDSMMTETVEGEVSVTVPTAFLSTRGGGIFVTLTKSSDRAHLPPAPLDAGAILLNVDLRYVAADSGAIGTDQVTVSAPRKEPSATLKLAHALIDEYLVLHEATTAFHLRNDAKTAHRLLAGLDSRLAAARNDALRNERKLVTDLMERAAFYAGYGGEAPRSIRHLGVVGSWEIVSLQGIGDLRIGDRLEFSSDRDMTIYRKRNNYRGDSEVEPYQINERQLYLEDSDVVFDYAINENRMTLSVKGNIRSLTPRIVLRRIENQ